MSRRLAPRSAVLALLTLALAAPSAHADPTGSDFTIAPDPPSPGEEVTFTFVPGPSVLGAPDVDWDVRGTPSFDETGLSATQAYDSPGSVTVRMRVNDDDGSVIVLRTFTVNAPPVVSFDFTPTSPLPGQQVVFDQVVSDSDGDALTYAWDFGDGGTSTEDDPNHAYSTAGTRTVTLTVTDEHGAVTTATRDVTVAPDPGPAARLDYSPRAPLVGDSITFTSLSTPSQGAITATAWDLNGDNVFTDAAGPEITSAFGAPGSHLVQMRVTQTNGLQSVAFETVTVSERPTPVVNTPNPGQNYTEQPPPPSRRPVRMRPFPVVRIAGVVLPNGALVRVLSVRVPRGAQVRVRCTGRGCPARQVGKSSATRLLRFARFERRLPAGVKLELFVRKADRIGKYTRFTIRAGKAPARMDRCLMPGRPRPVRCS
jgi:PKD repeat protein